VVDLLRRLQQLEATGQAFFVTPDAEEFIQRKLLATRLRKLVPEIRMAPDKLRTTLLKEPLLPYQLDGIAFAAGAGRAILADEMGLGKTTGRSPPIPRSSSVSGSSSTASPPNPIEKSSSSRSGRRCST
jgi:hypothetical protein